MGGMKETISTDSIDGDLGSAVETVVSESYIEFPDGGPYF